MQHFIVKGKKKMMINLSELLPIMLFILLIVLVIICIIIGIRLINTLDKVDGIIDDVNTKMTKVDGVFTLIDKTTDYASGVSDKIINGISSLLELLFRKNKRKEDKIEEE